MATISHNPCSAICRISSRHCARWPHTPPASRSFNNFSVIIRCAQEAFASSASMLNTTPTVLQFNSGAQFQPEHGARVRYGQLTAGQFDSMAPLSKEPFSVERDARHCPFCGVDAVDWDNELCSHLIADFGDRSNGDRGIMCGLGESRSGNSALDCLTGLERAIRDFVDIVEPTGYLDKTPSDSA